MKPAAEGRDYMMIGQDKHGVEEDTVECIARQNHLGIGTQAFNERLKEAVSKADRLQRLVHTSSLL